MKKKCDDMGYTGIGSEVQRTEAKCHFSGKINVNITLKLINIKIKN